MGDRWELGSPKVVVGETRLKGWEYQTGVAEEGPYQMEAAREACRDRDRSRVGKHQRVWEHQTLVAHQRVWEHQILVAHQRVWECQTLVAHQRVWEYQTLVEHPTLGAQGYLNDVPCLSPLSPGLEYQTAVAR